MGKFLNRQYDLKQFSALLDCGHQVVLAVGKPGVGKTRLIRQAAEAARRFCYVPIDRGLSSDGKARPADLVELLSQKLDLIAIEEGLPSLADVEPSVTEILSDPNRFLAIAAKASKLAAGLKEARDQVLSARGTMVNRSENRMLHVQEALKRRGCLIHIDHADGCSAQEMRFIAGLVETTSAVFVLEIDPETEVQADLPKGALARLDVPQLEVQFAEMLFRTLPEPAAIDARTTYNSFGDLRPFERWEKLIHRSIDVVLASTSDGMRRMTETALRRLPTSDLNGLIAISAHSGTVDQPLLDIFLKQYAADAGLPIVADAATLLRRLDHAVLLAFAGPYAEPQVSARQIIENDAKLSTIELAYRKCWREFYRSAHDIPLFIPEEQRSAHLLRQCAMLGDRVGIARTLEEIGLTNRNAYNLASVAGYIGEIVDKVSFPSGFDGAEARQSMASALIGFLYEAGWFEEAYERITRFKQRSLHDRLFHAELLCASGREDRGVRIAFAEIEALQAQDNADPNAELCLELILIHGFRQSNRFAEARRRYETAVLQVRYRSLIAYPVLLRFADLCLSTDEDVERCAVFLEEAVERAVSLNLETEIVLSLNSLVQHYGYHDLEKAKVSLERLESLADGIWFQRVMLLNNRAVLSIYLGTATSADLRSLERALLLCVDRLDTILVRCNILAYRMIYGDDRFVVEDSISDLADLIDDESIDTEIRRIALYNLEQASSDIGQDSDALAYRERWLPLESGIDARYWRCRRTGSSSPLIPTWRLAQRYHPIYLSHWHIGPIPFQAIVNDG